MRWLIRTDFRSFYFLNATQFLGTLNDNIFKLLVIYWLINMKGPAAAGSILSLVGAVFVIPFLVFSSGAGVLADRISKRTIIVFTKFLELLSMIFGMVSVYFGWEIGAYASLFLMSTQSAIFGPSKYGIILELVESKKVSKANGAIASFTYLAIVFGTFIASFITDITNKNFVFEGGFCVFIAVLGLLASLGIGRVASQNSSTKINPLFLYEIYQTLKFSWKIPYLIPAIYGSSFFFFLGAFTQLNIIPFAMQSLSLSEMGGGYLFSSTAIGVALGAALSGKLSKDRVEPGISCISGFFFMTTFFLLYFFSWSLTMIIITLAFLGFFAGAYLVPFDSFVQANSPDEKRGQIVAAANFLSFVGALLAALTLYIFNESLGFSAASGFALMGFMTFVSNIIMTGRLSGLFFPFFVERILKPFRSLKLDSPVPDPSTIVIFQSHSWYDAILLFSCLPRLKILTPERYMRHFPWFNGLVECVRIVPPKLDIESTIKTLLAQAQRFQGQNASICLFFHRRDDCAAILEEYKKIFERLQIQVLFAHEKKERIPKRGRFFRYDQKQISFSFSKDILETQNSG